jgi:hypothetical protein
LVFKGLDASSLYGIHFRHDLQFGCHHLQTVEHLHTTSPDAERGRNPCLLHGLIFVGCHLRQERFFWNELKLALLRAPSPCMQAQLLAQGQTQGSAPRAHQQALTTGPFGNTCEADAVSPEVAMGGLQDRDVYNQGDIKWIQYKINTTFIYHLPVQIYSTELSIRSNTVMQ